MHALFCARTDSTSCRPRAVWPASTRPSICFMLRILDVYFQVRFVGFYRILGDGPVWYTTHHHSYLLYAHTPSKAFASQRIDSDFRFLPPYPSETCRTAEIPTDHPSSPPPLSLLLDIQDGGNTARREAELAPGAHDSPSTRCLVSHK
jgi:hypothetical protein